MKPERKPMKDLLEDRCEDFIYLIESAAWVLVFFALIVVGLSFFFYAIAER